MSRAAGLDQIEYLIWHTGTRDRLLVERIIIAIRGYARQLAERAEQLPAERAGMLLMDADGSLHSATLAELLDPHGDGSDWWPR